VLFLIPLLSTDVLRELGYEIRFYAILTLGPKFRLVSLTPSISCVRAASDGRERKALHSAFMAASVLLARIDADIENRLSALSPTVYYDMFQPYLPAVTQVRAVKISKMKAWHRSQPYRYLYDAETESKERVVVKFTPRYSAELHKFCADQGHAPALLACERLPGDGMGL
jgi:hypothetical protein